MTSILIVDDDKDITSNLADILGDLGYLVATANDGQSALELVHQNEFDIALLDFKMPDTDGASLYEQIRKAQPKLVAIMITAYAGSDGVERAKDAGTWKVLRKPVDIRDLVDLIGNASKQPAILIVDDDRDFCENLWQIFRDRELRVAFAHEEATALQQLKSNAFSIILLDLHLGDGTSKSVFESLQQLGQLARTIVVTGNRSKPNEALQQMIDHGAKTVHYKPLDLPALIQSIETVGE